APPAPPPALARAPPAPEPSTLSLHDALPISSAASTPRAAPRASASPPPAPWCSAARPSWCWMRSGRWCCCEDGEDGDDGEDGEGDRKSTRLNSSHDQISYAVFCLKKKIAPAY